MLIEVAGWFCGTVDSQYHCKGKFLKQAPGSKKLICQKTGHFYWTFWVAVFMNLFTNASTALFWVFSRYCEKRYMGRRDTATNEHLTEKNRSFELKKVFQLPWTFWAVLSFSLFQTSAAIVFSQNSTELAEKRFKVDSIKAGWYSALSKYTGKPSLSCCRF